MKTTRYFDEQVLRKRPYLRTEWIAAVLADPLMREQRSKGALIPGVHYEVYERKDLAHARAWLLRETDRARPG